MTCSGWGTKWLGEGLRCGRFECGVIRSQGQRLLSSEFKDGASRVWGWGRRLRSSGCEAFKESIVCFAIAKEGSASAERWRLWRTASCNSLYLSARFISAISRSVSEVADRISSCWHIRVEFLHSWSSSVSSREARSVEFLPLSMHPMTSWDIVRKGHVLSLSGRSLQMSAHCWRCGGSRWTGVRNFAGLAVTLERKP